MKIFSILVGMALPIALYLGMIWLGTYSEPSQGQSSDFVPISGLVMFVLVILPVIFFLSSIPTGFLIEPYLEKSYTAFLFYSPGLYYFAIVALLTTLFSDFSAITLSSVGFCCSGVLAGILWSAVSWAGVALGYKLRAKIRGDK